jgi:hypothetical protein
MKAMKTKNTIQILLACVFSLTAFSCSDLWDSYYHNSKTDILNDQVLIVDQTTEEYVNSVDTLSDMYLFLKENGIFEEMEEKNELHTLFMVFNSDFTAVDTSEASYVANAHVTDISISPSNLYDDERILMWHGKYVSVSMDSAALAGQIDQIEFGGNNVRQVIKTTDGYIYVLNGMISTPKSLYEVINALGDDYSIFKKMVLAENVLTFDKDNSKATGVDKTGNTIYDSVFTVSNPFFDDKSFDLTSESLTATVMIPSNKVLQAAMDSAKIKLKEWGMTRDTAVLKNWILEASFFRTKYTPAALLSDTDIYSIYDRQWRTIVQQVDMENPTYMSNGIAYDVKYLKIPNNMLMYRLKDYFYYYENCTDTQKAAYFAGSNLTFSSCSTDVEAWTPLAGVWSSIQNRVLNYTFTDGASNGFMLDFVPVKLVSNGEGGYTVQTWKIPPGEYTFCMGFKQSLNLDVTIYLNGTSLGSVTLGSSTTFHYDRGAGGYPEGYQEALDEGTVTHSKKAMYDRDGGQISAAVTIKGDANGNPAPITIRIENSNLNSSAKMVFHHWCLRPTSNNY